MPLNSSAEEMILARALKVVGLERPISYSDCELEAGWHGG